MKRTEEYSAEFQGDFVFGYFDQIPTPEEAATVYFQGSLPNDWDTYPECAVLKDGFNVPPEKIDGCWRILLGNVC